MQNSETIPSSPRTLSEILSDRDTETNESVAIWSTRDTVRWCDLAREFRRLREQLRPLQGQRVGVRVSMDRLSVAALANLEGQQCECILLDARWSEARVADLARELEFSSVVMSDHQQLVVRTYAEIPGTTVDASGVVVLTSGTSGRFKAARHTWHGLSRPVRITSSDAPQRWLLAYRPHLYAGLQVVLQALLNRGLVAVPSDDEDPNAVAKLMSEASVVCASATPAYWRRLLMWADPAWWPRVPLRQITLGGEVVDQAILDRLRSAFPQARIVHIYATTELGRCFAVSDGRSGFPATLLDHLTPDGVELSVREGQLWVRSSNAMQNYLAGMTGTEAMHWSPGDWFATGDLVEIVDDRVHFIGRASDMINVGGNKVHPLAVEQVIREVAGVLDVRVFGQASSVAGQLVACQVVPHAGHDRSALRTAILQHCHQKLDRYQIPRLVDMVDQLDLSPAGKMVRQNPG